MRLALPAAIVLAALACASIAQAQPAPSTPELITAAVERGDVGKDRGQLLRAYALAEPDRLPRRYRSSTPWDGTLVLRDVRRAARQMEKGETKREIQALLEPSTDAITSCSSSSGDLPNDTSTTHFFVEYDAIGAGLDVNDYATSLETAWNTEITAFGWAAPPVAPTPAPGSKYHVRIDNLSSGLYGFVSPSGTHAGSVGNNPNTAWNEGDAYASCMVLNEDYTGFPSPAQASLDSTTAHEFNHSIQFGYGALNGPNAPDDNFVEAGATWMEDEGFDAANDNYHYLWPVFSDSMGQYGGSPYAYWITFRGLTERYGTGVAGGGEDVMQRFWELTSQNTANSLGAMQQALTPESTTLADAFHAYAIAVKFKKACGAGYVLPYCFEEAAAYPSNTSAAANAATLITVGDDTKGSGITIEDNYSARWVGLPTSGGSYSVTLQNLGGTTGTGALRGTVVCDTGSTLTRETLPGVVTDGGTQTLATFDPTGCSQVVLAVTNQTKTADNPSSSSTRKFQVQTAPVTASSHTLTVTKDGDGSGTVTSTDGLIDCGVDCTETYPTGTAVTLNAAEDGGSSFTGWSNCPAPSGVTCQVTMSQDRTVTATFQLQPDQALAVTKLGDGSGTVTSAPGGISCGSDCDEMYDFGTVVTLTANPSGSVFVGWSGCGSTSGQTCQVTMSQARNVTARFEGPRTLTVSKSGDGAGTVTSSPPGISCGSTCANSFAYGTVVTLTASPASGSTFAGWSGACAGTAQCVVTMTVARNVTATFAIAPTSEPPPPEPEDTNPLTPPPAFSPVVDTVAPLVAITATRLRATKRGVVRVPIECPVTEPADCEGRLTLRLLRSSQASAAARVVGRKTFRIPAGEKKRVRLRLSKLARERLARRGVIRVRAIVLVEDAAGNSRKIRRKLRVRAS